MNPGGTDEQKNKYFTDRFDEFYLKTMGDLLEKSFDEFEPDIIFYNAGSDVLQDDLLGDFLLSPDGLVKRDEMVISKCAKNKVPFVMMLSGGYGKENYKSVYASISNLVKKFGNKYR